MRSIINWLILMAVILASVWIFGSREPAPLDVADVTLSPGLDLDHYLATRENAIGDVAPEVQKQIVWADAPNTKTNVSIVYIHGFSASLMELRPVPDRVASALGANLFFTRLTGHGRGSTAMQGGTVAAWMEDVGEALAIGRALGRKTILMTTSTGGTLAAAAALDAAAMADVAGIIFVSPNFALQNAAAPLLTWPYARHWVPLIVGDMRQSKPRNAQHGRYWTTRYPTVALLPMAALVAAVDDAEFSAVTTPALFYFSPDDRVVRPDRTVEIAKKWGAATRIITPQLTPQDDPLAHLIAGDIVSPGQTNFAVEQMLDWIRQITPR